MRDLLKDSNLRWTKQRQIIYDEICQIEGHFTAESVWQSLSSKDMDISLSTIYRTLQLLEEKNKLKQIPLGGETAEYECVSDSGHGHHHVVCLKCGKTMELHVDMMEDLEKLIKNKYRFTVLGHSVVFNGFCPKCKAKQSDNGN